MDNNITDEQRAAMIGEVIISARRVETRLHELCGSTEVAGIHALTELLAARLPEDTRRQLHFIAAVRNGAAHEAGFTQSPDEFQRFQQCCTGVLDTLNRLFPEQSSQKQEPVGNTLDLAVEKEAFAAMSDKLARLGYFPLAGNIYLFCILLYTIFRQGFLLLLAGLYCCSAVLGLKGWQSAADRGLLYVAGGALLFAYIATAVLSFCAPVKKLPKSMGLLPGVNILYLVIRFLRDLQWGRFVVSSAGLGLFATAVILAMKGLYNYAAAALLLNWFFSIGSVFLRGAKGEK